VIGRVTIQPAGHVQPLRSRRRVDGLELLPPAAGHHGVQSLQHRLGADVGGDLRAAERVAVQRHLHHRPEADRSGRKRPAKQLGRLGMRAGGRPHRWFVG